jgi:hypothetical protein
MNTSSKSGNIDTFLGKHNEVTFIAKKEEG